MRKPSELLSLTLLLTLYNSGVRGQGAGEKFFMNNGECFGDLNDLFQVEDDYKKNAGFLELMGREPFPWQQRVYKLCPDTTYRVGNHQREFSGFIGGQYGLGIRNNMTIQCGDDGSSENNCVVERSNPIVGNFLLFAIPDFYQYHNDRLLDFDIDGAHVKGITFGEANAGISAIIAGQGVLTYEDIRMVGLRETPGFFAFRWNNAIGDVLTVRFINCLFADNKIIPEPPIGSLIQQQASEYPNNMIMTEEHFVQDELPGQGVVVEIDRCIFRDNDFSDPVLTDYIEFDGTSFVANTGNTTVTNSCFINNRLDPTLGEEIFTGRALNFANNYLRNPRNAPPPGTCDFVFEVDDKGNRNCYDADRFDYCTLIPIDEQELDVFDGIGDQQQEQENDASGGAPIESPEDGNDGGERVDEEGGGRIPSALDAFGLDSSNLRTLSPRPATVDQQLMNDKSSAFHQLRQQNIIHALFVAGAVTSFLMSWG